jgi:UDP-N-acetylmuramoylalanine--D-glutamate ligase
VRYFPVQNKSFVVLGLARTGLAAVEWLLGQDAHVYAFDGDSDKQKAALNLGAHGLDDPSMDWSRIAAVVHSPGISPDHPITQEALKHHVPLISDCNLLRLAYPDAKFIGITGTNGKSTTTTLIAHILKEAGLNVAIGGNVGVPALSLPAKGDFDYVVLELSSYQLELSDSLSLDVVAWINISEDHLERHGSMVGYVESKKKIFATTKNLPQVVIGIDDSWSEQVCQDLLTASYSVIPVSCHQPLATGIYVDQGILIDQLQGQKEDMLDLKRIPTLQGIHNHQNVAVAYGACLSLGLDRGVILQAIQTFPGLAHRQELVATIHGIKFINDSKATNADAAAKALATYDQIYWIVGGKDKSDGIDPLKPYFSKIRHAFLIGASMDRFAETLKGYVDVSYSGTLATALEQICQKIKEASDARGVVLLSPACASYDQFKDFEHRGNVFREQVKILEATGC